MLAPYFGHFIERKTALWPRFPIFPNFSKIKIRWNLLIWFLEIGHLRVSLGKIWAICQMGRWSVFLDPYSQPFLRFTTSRDSIGRQVSAKVAGAWVPTSICARAVTLSSSPSTIVWIVHTGWNLVFCSLCKNVTIRKWVCLFRFNFVFQTIGLVFLNVRSFASILYTVLITKKNGR